ncbi:MAG: DNA-directed RNA polymerase subunit omega [Armatimonadota bacterium]
MIYPQADRLEDQVKSRYTLVVLAAKRAKQLRDGASKLIETTSTNPLTIALEEIAAGKVIPEVASYDEVPSRRIEPELEAAASMETAQEEAAELTAEAPSVVDEAARIAELLKVPGMDEESTEEESDTDAEAASEEEAQPGQAEE